MCYDARRVNHLDGLRGIAALTVVVFHYLSAFVPALTPDQTANPYWLSDTPLAVLINGPFAVIVFFVLSGYVVSKGWLMTVLVDAPALRLLASIRGKEKEWRAHRNGQAISFGLKS